MPTKEVKRSAVVQPDSLYLKKLRRLDKTWKDVEGASDRLSKAILKFAQEYVALEEEAKRLDGDDDDLHNKELKKMFQSLVENSSESVISKWRKIGKLADKLLPYAKHLPTNYESLYMISQGVEDKTFDIKANVAKGYLTPATTVRNLRITVDKARGKKKRSLATKAQHSEIAVTFVFKGTHGEIARFIGSQLSVENLRQLNLTEVFDENLKRIVMAKETKDALEEMIPASDLSRLCEKLS
jgi:hypothetical protein